MISIVWAIVFILVAPVAGGLVMGIDRRITARMQGRFGPPILQPFYDVGKLFEKEQIVVHEMQAFYVLCYFVFIVFTGALFFAGADVLLVIFALTLAQIFLVLGAYAANSPYSHIGAERELLQIMAYEPMVILTAVGFYVVTKSFEVGDIAGSAKPVILFIPGIFLGFLYVLTIKLRKSPFDISASHHAHQEIVKGVTTEFSGPTLGLVEVTHWYETIFLFGFIWLFFGFNPLIAAIMVVVVYLLEIFIDNTNARVKWQLAVKSSWLVAAIAGVVNLGVLYYLGV